MIMRDTIFCAIPEDADRDAIAAVDPRRVAEVQNYVPGYRLLNEPQFDQPSIDTGGQAMVTRSSRSRARATTCRRTPATSTS